jgi:arylsulfatase A-like enzyme
MTTDDTPDRPNVLVVLTDQQRWDTVGAYGSPMDLTPNLDAMAAEGARVDTTVTPQPLCGPARSCLQTGQYATESGCWKNGIPLPDVDHLLARQFAAAGYETGYVGKWHLAATQDDPVPADRRGGYEDRWLAADVLEFTSHPYEGVVYDGDGDPVNLDGYRVDGLTDLAVSALESSDDPFFLFLSYLEPHHQNDRETYVAPDGYADRYRQSPYVPPDLRDRPGDWYEELPDYYGICRRIDECLGRLLEALERLEVADDTLVVFASDHGCHFRTRPGEYKRSPHDASIRVPLVFRGPGVRAGQTIEGPVSLLDVPPTLLDAAGIEVPDEMQGHSLYPEFAGRRADGDERPDEVFVQISESQIGRAVRTDRWKYAIAAPGEYGWRAGLDDAASDVYVERYLYDLAADPAERVNLAGRPEYRDVADELRERLLARIERVEGASPEVVPHEDPGFREY